MGTVDTIAIQYTATKQRLDMVRGAAFGGDMTEGAKNFQTGINDYYSNFLTDAERYNASFGQMQGYLQSLGVELKQFDDPAKMKEWWKNLINGWDHSTEASNEAFGRLITMSGQYSQLISLEEKLQDVRLKGVNTALDDIMKLRTGDLSSYTLSQRAELSTAYFQQSRDTVDGFKRGLDMLEKRISTTDRYDYSLLMAEVERSRINQEKDASRKDIVDKLNEVVERLDKVDGGLHEVAVAVS